MSDLGSVLLTNAATAALLGLAVAGVARWIRRPATVHALWVVVLLDLLMPPIFEVGVLPRDLAMPSFSESSSALTAPLAVPFVEATVPAEERAGAALWLAALWLAGALCVAGLAIVRARRFAIQVRGARAAPAGLTRRLGVLARRAGLDRAPPLRLVRGRVTPMLRWRRGALEILFPVALLSALDPAERDALLLHELAHVRRRDPWIRLLELAASSLFWWHPVVFWARRSLRRAEELSCDARVLEWLPGHGRDYARGLLKTVEFLGGSQTPLPALASGAGTFHSLEERLTMIIENYRPRAITRPVRWTLALAALAGLLAFPIVASRDDAVPASAAEQHRAELEQLASEMHLLQARQEALQQRMAELDAAGVADVRTRLEAEGARPPMAEAIRRELVRRQTELELAAAGDHTAVALGLHRRRLEERRRELEAAGQPVAAAALEQQLAELELALGAAEQDDARPALRAQLDALRRSLAELTGAADRRSRTEDELRRALDEVERSLRELRDSRVL